jgi:hypothetical protein
MLIQDTYTLYPFYIFLILFFTTLIKYRLFTIPIIIITFLIKVLLFYISYKVYDSTVLLICELNTCNPDTVLNILVTDVLRFIILLYLLLLYFIIFYNDFSTGVFFYYILFSYTLWYTMPIFIFLYKSIIFFIWLFKCDAFQLLILLSLFHFQCHFEVMKKSRLDEKLSRFKYFYIIVFLLQVLDFFTIL